MPFFENLVEGLSNAAGSNVGQRIEGLKADRKATAHEELHANTQSILDDVSKLQERRAALPAGSPEIVDIDKQLAAHQQAFTDLYHPVKNPDNFQKLGGFLKQHITGKAAKPAPQSNAVTPDRMAQLQAGAAGTKPEEQNPYTLKKKFLMATGVPEDEATRLATGQKDVKPPHMSDYATGLKRFVEAEGGDPDNPTAAQEQAFRDQRLKDAAAARTMDTTRTSTTVDPFGVSSTTKSLMQRRPAGSAATPATQPQTPIKTPGEARQRAATVAPAGARQLDAQGHIPTTAKVNPYLREAANQILDGMDISKSPIPARDRQAAAELARQYGWKGQGVFGPKDMLMLRESTSIIKQLADSPSLAVFDDFASRQKIQQVMQNPDKRGFIGQAVQGIAAANLNQSEQDFITLYNQAVGRIAGLSQLVRSGRATEATIERLKTELPNPFNTTNSGHAKQKLAQIQNEIDIAMQKGQFVESPSGDTSDDDFLKKF